MSLSKLPDHHAKVSRYGHDDDQLKKLLADITRLGGQVTSDGRPFDIDDERDGEIDVAISKSARHALKQKWHAGTNEHMRDVTGDFRATTIGTEYTDGILPTLDGNLNNTIAFESAGVPVSNIYIVEMVLQIVRYQKILAKIFWPTNGPKIIFGKIQEVVMQPDFPRHLVKIVYLDFLGRIPLDVKPVMSTEVLPNMQICAVTQSHRRPTEMINYYNQMVGPTGFEIKVKIPQAKVKTYIYALPDVAVEEPAEWLVRRITGHFDEDGVRYYKALWDYTPPKSLSKKRKWELTRVCLEEHECPDMVRDYLAKKKQLLS